FPPSTNRRQRRYLEQSVARARSSNVLRPRRRRKGARCGRVPDAREKAAVATEPHELRVASSVAAMQTAWRKALVPSLRKTGEERGTLKSGKPHSELTEWYHQRRGAVNCGNHGYRREGWATRHPHRRRTSTSIRAARSSPRFKAARPIIFTTTTYHS